MCGAQPSGWQVPAPCPPGFNADGRSGQGLSRVAQTQTAPTASSNLNVAVRDAQAVAEVHGHHELLEQHPGMRLWNARALRPAPVPAVLPLPALLAAASSQRGLRPPKEDSKRQELQRHTACIVAPPSYESHLSSKPQ